MRRAPGSHVATRPHGFTFRRIAALLLTCALTPGLAIAQSTREGDAITRAITELTLEGEQSRDEGTFAREDPDFAGRFDGDIPRADLQRAIVQPQHRDVFIDAYIRWQLTSFDFDLPEMTDREFARFMNNAPRLIENPKADPELLTMLARMEASGRLSPAYTEKLRALIETLDERTMIVEHFNRPALGFRERVAEKLGKKGVRPRFWMIENLAVNIMAGWSVRGLKGELTRNFTASVSDESFTETDRRAAMMILSKLVGPGRSWLNEVTYFADGRIKVSISTSQVTQRNMTSWRKRLYGMGKR